jgi:hypothetical protein
LIGSIFAKDTKGIRKQKGKRRKEKKIRKRASGTHRPGKEKQPMAC